MSIVNGFKFGEISRKQAGRFSEEGYQQGSFKFRNCITMYDNGMTRRYPLRTLISISNTTTIYMIHSFRISDTENFVLAIGSETVGENTNNVIIIYQFSNGNLKEVSRIRDYIRPVFAIDDGQGSFKPAVLSEEVCRGIRFAQYYNRMYIVSQEFRTLYVAYNGGSFTSEIVKLLVNKDAKSKVYFIKGAEEGTGRVLFKGSDGKYYTDIEFKEEYTLKEGEEAELANNSYVSSYDDYEDNDDINNGTGTYPGVIAIVNDSLYLANTKLKPSTIWKSRTIGSSQWIEGGKNYSPDTMHDFIQFQVVASNGTELRDSSEWPLTKETGYYETYNSQDAWFVPNTDYKVRLTRTPKEYLSDGYDCFFFKDSSYTDKYTWTSKSEKPSRTYDSSGNVVWKAGDTTLYAIAINEVYPFSTTPSARDIKASDYTWVYAEDVTYNGTTYSKGGTYSVNDTVSTNPVKKPLLEYDLSDATKLYEDKTTVDFVSTDSCAVRMELNTGSDDCVRFISAGCGKIIVGSSTCEKLLPANFNAVSNMYSSHYSEYGSLAIEPIKLGRSFFFFQTGRKIRELYLDNGYMEDADVTALNHDIFNDEIVDTSGKTSPDPSIISVMKDGSIVQITYDRTGGLNSISKWHSGSDTDHPFAFKSLAVVRDGDSERLLTLTLDKQGNRYICYFLEPTEDNEGLDIYYDEIGSTKYSYVSFIETVYAEIYNNSLAFGRFKKATGMHIRPYKCGHIYVGNDERQLTKSNYRLDSRDEYIPVFGKSDKNFSMKIKSFDFEPMSILALSWEG